LTATNRLKELSDLIQYDVGVPPGYVAKTPEEAEAVAKKLSMDLHLYINDTVLTKNRRR
jgi:succinyl-CoA synthetase beta subunit